MKTSVFALFAAAGSAAAVNKSCNYAGVNIAGLDFGTDTSGSCTLTNAVDPGDAGINQMNHFVKNDGLNVFRLPVSWQYLTKGVLGGTLDSTNLAVYDTLMQGCLDSGAEMCIIDIHNYARWDGAIIGQGGPSNAEFASLWSQLATHYKDKRRVVFGIMNEPHDVDITLWAATVQEAVTAIRKAGATSQKMLLPGNDWTHATTFISDGSAAALSNITNLDGTTNNLIFDVHAYLDSDGSGTSTTCTTSNSEAFATLGDWLRTNERKAFLTETGGGQDSSTCLEYLCAQFDTLNEYGDVYLGWVGWAAGAFDSSYALAETPSLSGSEYSDCQLVSQCIVGKFRR